MPWIRGLAVLAASLVGALSSASASRAAPPPNPHDPCSRAGRDTCDTTGVGFYRVYRYGLRWFGDYRNAVAGAKHLFCLDLGYWYASRSFRYRPQPGSRLRNRTGKPVTVERQRRISYAIWRYGRSDNPPQQAAVMLYVHAMMGDARPGEVDPSAVGPTVTSIYRRIARETPRLHGPYRIQTRLPSHLRVGHEATATISVLSEQGARLPDLPLKLSAAGVSGLPPQVRTNTAGAARVSFTPTTTAGLRLHVETGPLAAPTLHVFTPTAHGASASGQRLAAPAANIVDGAVERHDVGASPQIETLVSAQSSSVDAEVTDTVNVSGLGGASMPVQVQLFGPFSTRDAIACSGTPYWSGSFVAHGDGSTETTPVRLDRAGYYAYLASITARPPSSGFDTTCGAASETTLARARPGLETAVAARLVRPGSTVSDRLHVHGLGRTRATIEVALYGPFQSRGAIRCGARHLYSRTQITVAGDGNARTPPVEVRRAGFYSYRERLTGSSLVAGATTPCTTAIETLLAAPRIVTGRGDVAVAVTAPTTAGRAPVRIRIDALGIDAPVSAIGIDVAHGVLGTPADIHRVGWWRDSSPLGAAAGTTLIAGHRDSARAGVGTFFPLARIRTGTGIQLQANDGQTYTYRVTSLRSYRKDALPLGIYARSGPARLVLVTCGGPFDTTTRHYLDNVVVTAVPTR